MNYYQIMVESKVNHHQTLTYSSEVLLLKGQRVLVSLKGRDVIGLVLDDQVEPIDYIVKEIKEIIDEKPIINQELLQLAKWLSYQTVSSLYHCFQTILPNQYRPKSNAKKIQFEKFIRKNPNFNQKLNERHQSIIDEIDQKGQISYPQANQLFKSSIKTLLKKEALVLVEIEKTYKQKEVLPTYPALNLTPQQQTVVDTIKLDYYHTYVLFGQTGSGKTEVYLQVVEKVIKENKQALILVPEISLTPQMIDRFKHRFGLDIGIYHSGLNDQEKYEQYLRVANGQVNVVVGTRSSIFLPFSHLGIIIIDEEHDHSFKQDKTPYYHTHDIALYRAQTHQCPVILGSATPSLTTYAKAIKGLYTLLELPSRISKFPLSIEVIDTQESTHQLSSPIISYKLQEEISHILRKDEQVILLLNRRSYAPVVMCQNCLTTLMCPHCDVTLAYHHDTSSFRCHICDYHTTKGICPTCHHRVHLFKGYGTQRLEEVVLTHFPSARVMRMDADTTRKKNAHHRLLDKFYNHEIDVMIGTQMIAKGIDNHLVTCVGILNIDQGLLHTDFASCEKSFSLITQAAGRSGRGDRPGKVFIQSNLADHYVIRYAQNQDYKGFFMHEMRYRHKGQYPPYTYLIEILVRNISLDKAQADMDKIVECVRQDQDNVMILGPVEIQKRANLFGYRLVLKGKDKQLLLEIAHRVNNAFTYKSIVTFNVNPLELHQ